MLKIDGSAGEGGGQVLRTALGLSLVTGIPFAIEKIRAGRPRPGLQRQHLAAVTAAAQVGQTKVSGAALGSQSLVFKPGSVSPGEFAFSVGTAGSATLVLETILPALWMARAPSRLSLEGGTHNPWAPPFEFLERAFLPLVSRIGGPVRLTLKRRGFYPAGGGQISASIEPSAALGRLDLVERGAPRSVRASAIVARLPPGIAERELSVLARRLSLGPGDTRVIEDRDSLGPGNAAVVEVESEGLTEVFTGFGEKRVSAETVAEGLSREVLAYLESGAPVGEYLADQLLIPLALAKSGSFVTGKLSPHATTNMEVIRKFLDVRFETEPRGDQGHRIAVG